MNNRLDELHRLLANPVTTHLTDDNLAEMAAAEAAGEDVDVCYPDEMAHLAQCSHCATEYGELVAFSLAALGDMAAAAQAVTPEEVLLALLQKELAEPVALDAAEIVAALPLLFATPPATPEAFDASLAGTSLLQKSPALIAAARRNLAALTAFLVGKATTIWGQAVDVRVKTAVATQGYQLQLQPALKTAVSILSSAEKGREWRLLSRRVGHPVSWQVSARVLAQSATAGTLKIQADRPGLADASGRLITISYGERSVTAVTDATGTATFADVPIAALPILMVTIDVQ
jgi:hypothetical protein